MRTKTAPSEARQRLLETADRLFYRDGFRKVGIDKIIAEAGAAKMTLYSHFPSKNDLILAVLQHREDLVAEFFAAAVERHRRSGAEPLDAFFAALKDWVESPAFRGCAFINATVELADPTHPGTEYCRAQRDRFNATIRTLLTESLGPAAASLLPAISLLVEGAIVTAQMQQNPAAANTAREAARLLVETQQKR